MAFISIHSNLEPQQNQIILGFTPFPSPGPDLGAFQNHGIPNIPELKPPRGYLQAVVCYLVGSCTPEPLLSLLVFLPSARRISGGERSSMREGGQLGQRVGHGQRSRTGMYRPARGCATRGASCPGPGLKGPSDHQPKRGPSDHQPLCVSPTAAPSPRVFPPPPQARPGSAGTAGSSR